MKSENIYYLKYPSTVSKSCSESFLARWMRTQLQMKKTGRLSSERISQMNTFPALEQDKWYFNFLRVRIFLNDKKRFPVPENSGDPKEESLSIWLKDQKKRYIKDELDKEKTYLLESLSGWTWCFYEDKWWKRYEELKNFYIKNGFYPSLSKANNRLVWWFKAQKRAKRGKGNYRLTLKREKALAALPKWEWERDFDGKWVEKLSELKKFVRLNKKLPSSIGSKKEKALAYWTQDQKKLYASGNLEKWKANFLLKIKTWDWDGTRNLLWNKTYYLLSRFLSRHKDYPSGKTSLGAWVITQRKINKKGKLDSSRKILLMQLPKWEWQLVSRNLVDKNKKGCILQ